MTKKFDLSRLNRKEFLALYLLQLRLILVYLRNLKIRQLLYLFSAIITMPIIGYIIYGVIGAFSCGLITAIVIYFNITKKIKNGEIGIIPK